MIRTRLRVLDVRLNTVLRVQRRSARKSQIEFRPEPTRAAPETCFFFCFVLPRDPDAIISLCPIAVIFVFKPDCNYIIVKPYVIYVPSYNNVCSDT